MFIYSFQNIDFNENYTISENTRRDNSTNITIQKDAHTISKLQDRYSEDLLVVSTDSNRTVYPFQETNATWTRKCEKCDNLVNDSNVGHSIQTQEGEKRTLNSTDINQDSKVTIVLLHDTDKSNSETQRRGQSSTVTDKIGVISQTTEADHGTRVGARRKVYTKYRTTTTDVLALLRSHIDSSKLQYKTLTKEPHEDSWNSGKSLMLSVR